MPSHFSQQNFLHRRSKSRSFSLSSSILDAQPVPVICTGGKVPASWSDRKSRTSLAGSRIGSLTSPWGQQKRCQSQFTSRSRPWRDRSWPASSWLVISTRGARAGLQASRKRSTRCAGRSRAASRPLPTSLTYQRHCCFTSARTLLSESTSAAISGVLISRAGRDPWAWTSRNQRTNWPGCLRGPVMPWLMLWQYQCQYQFAAGSARRTSCSLSASSAVAIWTRW
mmetsp:Transcript_48252/g.149001  ORF Transcript_48252/g.149001 Transcript_48252/m.149001 type:complete len:225 (+) Transcript_48252:133-807(+)